MSNEQYYGFFFSLNGNAVNKSKMELAETLAESIAMALSTEESPDDFKKNHQFKLDTHLVM